jgi:hypothetical protein
MRAEIKGLVRVECGAAQPNITGKRRIRETPKVCLKMTPKNYVLGFS